jgi:hypothetical protein
MHEKTTEKCLPNTLGLWSHHVRETSMQYLTLSYLLRFWNENQLKSNKKYGDSLYTVEKARYTFLENVQRPEDYQNRRISWENWRSEWYKEATIRWRTSKDVNKEVEMMRGYPLSLVFWITQRGDYSTWSSDWTKQWLLSVQSRSTTTPLDRKFYNRVRLPQATP